VICPFCHHTEVKVLDSRPDNEGKSIRRRRECFQCAKRWRTVERVENEMPLVVKKNHSFEAFNKAKLLNSMQVACGKRPVTQSQIHEEIAKIEWKILEENKEKVSTVRLGEEVMTALKSIDEIAYIRFASVYRKFRDAGELIAEMKDLIKEEKKEGLGPKSNAAVTH